MGEGRGIRRVFVVQARPEAVQTRREAGALKSYTIRDKGQVLARGLAIDPRLASG
jgi:pyruvate,water dikinase